MARLFRIIDSFDPERKLNAARDSFRLVIKDSDPYPGFAGRQSIPSDLACHVQLLHNNVNIEEICWKKAARDDF
jgi:hypothetical protein